MIPVRDSEGRPSRTVALAQQLALLSTVEGSLLLFQPHIPANYAWVYPVIHLLVALRLTWLRFHTSTPMQ